jgi:hypothetical protein
MEACPSITLAIKDVIVPWRDFENKIAICAEAEGKVKPTMPEALPTPLIEYVKGDKQKQV